MIVARLMAGVVVAVAPVPLPKARPTLVVVITVDQLRPDYLAQWRPQLTDGFARLLRSGAVFDSAFQDHAISETAVGHAVLLAGRHPSSTGIVMNELGVQDSTAPLVAGIGTGASPVRFRGTVLMDWLKAASPQARGLSVSRKDRAAILPMGRTREEVYWDGRGVMTTSTHYARDLPPWVRAFNARRIPQHAAGSAWELLLPARAYAEPDSQPWENGGEDVVFPHAWRADSTTGVAAFLRSPAVDAYTLAFALEGVNTLGLGRGPAIDLLAISLSATDYIGHAYGPGSREMHDQIVRLDRALGAFLDSLFRLRDSSAVVIALTADHGVTPPLEYSRAVNGLDVGGLELNTFGRAMDSALTQRFGPAAGPPGPWASSEKGLVLIRRRALTARGVNVDSLVALWRAAAGWSPWVARIDTRATLAAADTARDAVARRWRHLLPPDWEAELMITLRPGCLWLPYWTTSPWSARVVADHGQPSDDDTHVPLVLWGTGVRAGRISGRVGIVDLAPTLARLAGVRPLEPLDGRVLAEALATRE